jgi:transcriptional regulator
MSDDEAWATVEEAAAGFVTVATGRGLRTVFAPVLVADDRSELVLHVSRGNRLWRDASAGDEAVALFKAADTYVSPTLYPERHTDPRVAPTWDYAVVEVSGPVTVRDDEQFVASVVRRLTERQELPREDPWAIDMAPEEFVSALLKGIVGLTVSVDSIVGAKKLSQTKGAADRAAVRESLRAGSDRERAVARLMEREL